MKINLNTTIKLFTAALLLGTSAVAQKLPNKQEISLRAPANIKIDGKADEWDNKFQAHNNATDLFYTISNDDEKLYLTIMATYRDIVDKILRGGITLTINHTVNKNDKEAVSVTYPVLRDNAASSVLNMFAGKSNEYRDANKTPVNVDDLNTSFNTKSKLIGIKGVKTITDEAISVYNEDNIKAVAKFDGNMGYTYELAIPFNFLKLPNDGAAKFSYRIKVNEPAAMQISSGGKLAPPMVMPGPPPPPMMTTSIAATDFWGEYILAKK